MNPDRKSSSRRRPSVQKPEPTDGVILLKDLAPRTDVHGGAKKRLFGLEDSKKPAS